MYGMVWHLWHNVSDIPVRTDRTVRHRCCHLWLKFGTIKVQSSVSQVGFISSEQQCFLKHTYTTCTYQPMQTEKTLKAAFWLKTTPSHLEESMILLNTVHNHTWPACMVCCMVRYGRIDNMEVWYGMAWWHPYIEVWQPWKIDNQITHFGQNGSILPF